MLWEIDTWFMTTSMAFFHVRSSSQSLFSRCFSDVREFYLPNLMITQSSAESSSPLPQQPQLLVPVELRRFQEDFIEASESLKPAPKVKQNAQMSQGVKKRGRPPKGE